MAEEKEAVFHGRRFKPNRDINPLQSLATQVSSKLEEGDFKGAVRVAASDEVFAVENEDTLKSLREKHPKPHPDSVIPTQQTIQSPIIVTASDVMKAIQSFPNGSSGGPDGLRPQHLKDLIFSSAGLGSSVLMESLTAFVNFVIRGDVPIAAQPFFFGASLVALTKKDMEG